MKPTKYVGLFWVFLALLGTCDLASAATFTDIQNPNTSITFGQTASGSFNIMSPGSSTYTISGFSSGNGTFSDAGGYQLNTPISDLTARFYLTDSALIPLDIVYVTLGSQGALGSAWSSSATFTFAGGSGTINLLEQNGTLNYSVTSFGANLNLEYALLIANTASTAANSVPDGGMTVALLGLGMIGVVIVQRRSARS